MVAKEDYKRLVKALKKDLSSDFVLQCLETDRRYNAIIPNMKIRSKNTYLKEVNVLLPNRCKTGDGVFIDVTPEFMYCDFSGCNLSGAYFHYANNQGANFGYANNQGADFGYANLKDVNWNDVISIENANFQNADLTGGINLPERINTKDKWIAECGVGNVNAETIWIDGTSILA
jgi:uncharacterized protein YjbI with pentapeptide repeats